MIQLVLEVEQREGFQGMDGWMGGGFTFYLSAPRFVQQEDFSARNYALIPDAVLKQIDR